MGIFKRIRVLEDDMYNRKIREKLKEYEEKYEREFTIKETYKGLDESLLHFGIAIDESIMKGLCYLGTTTDPLKKAYKNLCECEDKIKIALYDEILWEKKKEKNNDKEQ